MGKIYKNGIEYSGATNDYNSLANKPQINGNELNANSTADTLGLIANRATLRQNVEITGADATYRANETVTLKGHTVKIAGTEGNIYIGKNVETSPDTDYAIKMETDELDGDTVVIRATDGIDSKTLDVLCDGVYIDGYGTNNKVMTYADVVAYVNSLSANSTAY